METFEWKHVKPIGKPPSPREHFGCVVMDDSVFVFGGFNRAYCDDADDTFVLEMCKTETKPGKKVAEQELINATNTKTAQKMISEKFLKCKTDAIILQENKKREDHRINKKKLAARKNDRLKNDRKMDGKAGVTGPSRIRELNNREIRWSTRIQGLLQSMHHAAVVVERAIFSIGGEISLHHLAVHMLNVDEPELKWKLLPVKSTIPIQRENHSAVAYKEFIFIFGGQDTKMKTNLNSTFRFNTKTLEWNEVKATGIIPVARFQHSAVVVGRDMIVFGGYGSSVKNDLHSLDLESLHWSKIQTKGISPACVYGHSATVYKDHYIFIFGGRELDHYKYKYSAELFCFDVNSKKWTQPKKRGGSQQHRQGHSAFVHNGLFFIFGGSDRNSFLNSLFSYNPETYEWIEVTPIGEPPSPRHRFGCVAIDAQVFIFGGCTETYCKDAIILEMGCKKIAEKTVTGQESVNASDIHITDNANATSQDKAKLIKRKRVSSHEINKLSRTRNENDLDSRSKSLSLRNDSSCEDESNTRSVLYGASIKINPCLNKIKIKSDYIPPTVKYEPDE